MSTRVWSTRASAVCCESAAVVFQFARSVVPSVPLWIVGGSSGSFCVLRVHENTLVSRERSGMFTAMSARTLFQSLSGGFWSRAAVIGSSPSESNGCSSVRR